MKKLKRGLSLLLVLALVLTLVPAVFATDYEDFTDKDEITQVEAVKVLNGMGIIQGMDTGAFKPTGNLTRAEAAKIIAYLQLGESLSEKLTATASFSDVSSSHWASKYIAYCAAQGIIAGYGDGRFGPEDTLTAEQFLKMLLVAVGYDAKLSNLEGDQWANNTRKLSIDCGMVKLADLDLDFDREVACLYALGALNSVSYKDYTVSYVKDGVTVTQTMTINRLGDRFDLKKKVDSDADAFGRPIVTYTYNCGDKKTVVEAAVAADLSNQKLQETDITAVIGKKGYDLTVYVDGEEVADQTAASVAALGGTGVEVLIFDTDDESTDNAVEYTITVVHTYVATVSKVDTKTEKATLTQLGTTFAGTLTTDQIDGLAAKDIVSFNAVKSTDAGTVTVVSVENVTKLTGEEVTISRYKAGEYVVVGGETVNLSSTYAVNDNGEVTVGDATVYYDSYGNILYFGEVADKNITPDGYIYVTATKVIGQDAAETSFDDDVASAKVKGYDFETGKVVTLNLGIAAQGPEYYYLSKTGTLSKDEKVKVKDDDDFNDTIYGYYVLSNGDYVLEAGADDEPTNAAGVVAMTANEVVIEQGSRTVTVASDTTKNVSTSTNMYILSQSTPVSGTKVTGYSNFYNAMGGTAKTGYKTVTGGVYFVNAKGEVVDVVVKTSDALTTTTNVFGVVTKVGDTDEEYTNVTVLVGSEEIEYNAKGTGDAIPAQGSIVVITAQGPDTVLIGITDSNATDYGATLETEKSVDELSDGTAMVLGEESVTVDSETTIYVDVAPGEEFDKNNANAVADYITVTKNEKPVAAVVKLYYKSE